MFAFRHKETGEFMYVGTQSDSWGNNTTIQMVNPKWIDDFKDGHGVAVYCQMNRQILQDIIDNGKVSEYSVHRDAGRFEKPYNYVDMSLYEIVELQVK